MLLERVDFEARKKINDLTCFYRKDGNGIPVDTEKLIDFVEKIIGKTIEVEFREMKGRGFILPFRNRFLILIKISIHPYDQRLTLSHEIAHIFISYTDDEISSRKRPYPDNEERICDEIGMYLLCPPVEIEKFLRNEFHHLSYQLELFREKQKSSEIARLEEMAKRFEIPGNYLIRHIKKQFSGQKLKDIFAQFS